MWLRLVVAVVAATYVCGALGTSAPLTLLSDPLANCMDGTKAGYYFLVRTMLMQPCGVCLSVRVHGCDQLRKCMPVSHVHMSGCLCVYRCLLRVGAVLHRLILTWGQCVYAHCSCLSVTIGGTAAHRVNQMDHPPRGWWRVRDSGDVQRLSRWPARLLQVLPARAGELDSA